MRLSLVCSAVILMCAACSGENAAPNSGGIAGASGVGAAGLGGASGAAGMSSAAGTMQSGGSSMSAGGFSTNGGAAVGGGSGASGAAGSAGAVGAAGATGSSGVQAGCANDPHPLCIDFESGIDTAVWTGGTAGGVSTQDKAHGNSSYHAYKGAGVLTTTKLNGLTNVIWGRFYLRMTPGAPGGHGNIVGAYEGGDWYELGWQFNGLMGVWHYAGGENPLRSHPNIVDQWYCVELLFDGTKTEMPEWWVDGRPVEYYMGEPNNQKPHVIKQFDKLTIGFTSYAGLGLNPQPYGNNDPPVMTDMWLDDIAFDSKRIGCIAK